MINHCLLAESCYGDRILLQSLREDTAEAMGAARDELLSRLAAWVLCEDLAPHEVSYRALEVNDDLRITEVEYLDETDLAKEMHRQEQEG